MPDANREAQILAAAIDLVAALEFYADPASYFGVMVIGDRPCGEFADDAAPLIDDDYEGYRGPGESYYGKRAREALAAWRRAHNDDR